MFDLCSHGNVGITCPQCKGRQQPTASHWSAWSGPPAEAPVKRGHDDSRRTLDLGVIVNDAVGRISKLGDRDAAAESARLRASMPVYVPEDDEDG